MTKLLGLYSGDGGFFLRGEGLYLGWRGGGGGWLLNGILSIALKLKQGSRQIFPSTGR